MDNSPNAAVIGSLRGRLRRGGFLRLFFLLLIPLGFLLPCGVAVALMPAADPKAPPKKVEGITPPQVAGMVALGLPIVGLAGWLLMRGDKSKYVRALAVAEQADALGLTFTEKAPTEVLAVLNKFPLFADADKQLGSNCCIGERAGRRVAILDYATAYVTSVNEQTVAVVFGIEPPPPDFRLAPKGMLDSVLGALGADVIQLPEQAEFNKAFTLCGEAPDLIQRALSPKAVEAIRAGAGSVEAFGGDFAYHRHAKLAAPKDFPGMVETTLAIAAALR